MDFDMNIPLTPIKTNIQLNISNSSFLSIDIENQDQNFKDQVTITPYGLLDASTIKHENENVVYFGCELNLKSVSKILLNNY